MGMKAARFPNLYSKGFTPRPVMQFGPVLPLGVESLAEVIDLWLLSPLEDNQVIKLNENLPRGLEVRSFQQVALKEPSLSICYPYVRYSASMGKYSESIREPLKAWELSESWPVEHRGREIDLKRAIRSLDLEGESLSMVVSISSQDGHNANPILVMEKLLGISAEFRGEIALVKECLLTC
jgi:radical SAM-linked protein